MNLEETKKIIENKIEAETLTRNVRSQIKSYIDQKQNLREGFKETFQPLIASQEAGKASIDKEQNAMIEQLQKNQKALTEGLDKNSLAITQGFDKMEEVKRWDLSQLPGFEAIEEPEKEPEKEPEEAKIKISYRNLNKLSGYDKYPDNDNLINMYKRDYEKILEKSPFAKEYEIGIDKLSGEVKLNIKPVTLTYGKSDMDKFLFDTGSIELLQSHGLELPSYYKDKSLKELMEAYEKSSEILSDYKDSINNVAKYNYKIIPRIAFAYPDKGDRAYDTSKEKIRKCNVMEIYKYNLDQLRVFKEKTGTGIIHFNNPLQLLDKLELLAGSIFAGNNGAKQEFSQIAHLLHQLKVITKRQLNDLLKKYILYK